jgi:phosphohistidine phosphatase
MMDVYFLRHGDAGKKEAWTGPDRERPLSKEGLEQSRETAVAFAALKPGIALVISSPYLRARQTAEAFAAVLAPSPDLSTDDRLSPGFGRDQLAELIRENPGAPRLMLVGHEPDFSRAIGACIGGGKVELGKGALALVRLDETPSLKGSLLWLVPPKVLSR